MAGDLNVSRRLIDLPTQHQSDFIQIEKLRTPEHWMKAAQEGKVGYTTIMANEEPLTKRFGEVNFDLILSACKDLPGF